MIPRPTAPPLGIGNREWGMVGMGDGGGRFPALDEIGVGRQGADCLPDSPFPIAHSQGKGGGEWLYLSLSFLDSSSSRRRSSPVRLSMPR